MSDSDMSDSEWTDYGDEFPEGVQLTDLPQIDELQTAGIEQMPASTAIMSASNMADMTGSDLSDHGDEFPEGSGIQYADVDEIIQRQMLNADNEEGEAEGDEENAAENPTPEDADETPAAEEAQEAAQQEELELVFLEDGQYFYWHDETRRWCYYYTEHQVVNYYDAVGHRQVSWFEEPLRFADGLLQPEDRPWRLAYDDEESETDIEGEDVREGEASMEAGSDRDYVPSSSEDDEEEEDEEMEDGEEL